MDLASSALLASPLCHPDVGVAGDALPGSRRAGGQDGAVQGWAMHKS